MKKLMIVEWVDAHGAHGWMNLGEQMELELEPMKCKSVGFLYKEEKDYITLVQSTTGDLHINGYITIPKGWIKKKKVISAE